MKLKTSYSISLTNDEKAEIAKILGAGIIPAERERLANHIELMLQNAYCTGLEDGLSGNAGDREIAT